MNRVVGRNKCYDEAKARWTVGGVRTILNGVIREGLCEEVTVKLRTHWKDIAWYAKLWEEHCGQKKLLVQKVKTSLMYSETEGQLAVF